MADGTLIFDTKLDTSGFQNGMNEMGRGFDNTGGKTQGFFKKVISGSIAGTLAMKGVNAATNALSQSLSGAVSRYDTMKNFPRVMENMGISSKKADAAVERLSDGIDGLPTTLDSATLGVQRLTSKNGDIDKSTDYFLAMNDAIVAGGASSEIQASAVEQLSQSYSKGKMDMMEWRTLQMAMPAQLNQVAQAMGMTADELGEGLRKGDVSMEEFMQTLVKLDKEGTGKFASFADQARGATGGIGVGITNMKTAVVKGVADCIKAIDTLLSDNGMPSIGEMFLIAKDKIKGAFNVISNTISKVDIKGIAKAAAPVWNALSTALSVAGKTIKKVLGFVAEHAGAFTKLAIGAAVFLGIIKAYMIINSVITLFTALKSAMTMVSIAQAALNAVMMLNPITLIVMGIIALIAAFILLYNKCEWFRNAVNTVVSAVVGFFQGLVEKIKTAMNDIPGTLLKVVLFFATLPGRIILALGSLALIAIRWIAGFASAGLHKLAETASALFAKAKQLPQRIKAGIGNLASIGLKWIVGLWNAIRGKISSLASAVAGWAKKLPQKIKSGLGSLYSIGKNFIAGLMKGIKAKWENVVSWIQEKVSAIPQKIRDLLGIASPSKVMAEIGQWIPKGLALGIEHNFGSVEDAMSALGNATVGSFNTPNFAAGRFAGISSGGNTAGIAGNEKVVYQTINFNEPVQTPAETARTLRNEARFGLLGGNA